MEKKNHADKLPRWRSVQDIKEEYEELSGTPLPLRRKNSRQYGSFITNWNKKSSSNSDERTTSSLQLPQHETTTERAQQNERDLNVQPNPNSDGGSAKRRSDQDWSLSKSKISKK